MVLLLVGVCLMVVQRRVGRKLSVDLGGPKRLQAVSTLVVAIVLLPWATYQLLTQNASFPFVATDVDMLSFSRLSSRLLPPGPLPSHVYSSQPYFRWLTTTQQPLLLREWTTIVWLVFLLSRPSSRLSVWPASFGGYFHLWTTPSLLVSL